MHQRSVVIVEDDPMTRGLLAANLEGAGYRVATAANGSDAWRAVELLDPDGVVLDIDLGLGPTGFDLADSLLLEYPHLAVLFLTHLPDSRFAGRTSSSLPDGVGYLHKERLVDPSALSIALDAVIRGQGDRIRRDDLNPDRPLAKLSRTQIAVLRMVALGLTNQQIAERRGTTVRAVQDVIARSLGGDVGSEGEASVRVAAARKYMLAAGIPLSSL